MVQRPPVAPHFRVLPAAPDLPLEALEEAEAALATELALPLPEAPLFSFFFFVLATPPTPASGIPSDDAGEEAPESRTAPGVMTPLEVALMEPLEAPPKPESRVSS